MIERTLKLTDTDTDVKSNFQCYHNNRGYCRYEEKWYYQYYKEACSKKFCREKECKFRHPYYCKFGNKCKFYKKKVCAYKHDIANTNDKTDELKQEIKVSEEEIAKLNAEISDLKDVVKMKKRASGENC